MAAYRRVYDSRHLQADFQEPGSAPEPYARQSSTGYLYLFYFRSARYVFVLGFLLAQCPIHTVRQTRQDGPVCVVSGGVN